WEHSCWLGGGEMPEFDRAAIQEYLAKWEAEPLCGLVIEAEESVKACLAEIDRLTEDAKRLRDHLAGVTNGGVAYGLECDYEQSLAQTERLLGEVGADGFRHGWSIARADYQNGEAEGYRRGLEDAAKSADGCQLCGKWAGSIANDIRALID